MEKVAVILPVKDSVKHVEAAIKSIIANTRYPYKLIIVESESKDGTAELCNRLANEYDEIEVYHTKAEGLVKAINFGIDKAGDLDVYITQDDVILPKLYGRDWLTELVKINQNYEVGIIGTIVGGGISGPTYIDGLPWVGTWSMFIPRKTINKVGLFDENMGPGDDIDYAYRLYLAKLPIATANFWVDHHRKTEHFGDNEPIKEKMSKYFKQKWKLGEFKDG